MRRSAPHFNTLVAAGMAFAGLLACGTQAQAQTAELDTLFERLAEPDLENWDLVEADIWRLWSLSGSPAMDLLLRRGREATDEGDYGAAIDHLTALTDHAPEFAEGFNARAIAYFQAGLFGPAIADLQRALALNPRHFAALTGLAVMLEEMGQPELAHQAYSAAAAIHPHRPDLQDAAERLARAVEGAAL